MALHVYQSRKERLKSRGPGRKDPYLRITAKGAFLSGQGVKLFGDTIPERVGCGYDDEERMVFLWPEERGGFKLGKMRSATRRIGGKRLVRWLMDFGVPEGKFPAERQEDGKLAARLG
ncbi:MAG: hypothetical protein M0031_14295 [Thermaerobacter sp.]|nr:hypothetical protein [Thermaerobacter sp.]